MSLDTSDESLPDWVAEHASPWLQTLAPQQTDSSPNSDKIGPSKADDGAKLDVEKAVVKPSLVIASDLPGQVPVLLPEKLSTSRCLIEVVDSVSTDLAGDAGAVGRFSIVQHGQQQQAQLDLKGAVYSMTVVPCASTLCVVNIRQTEARVETVLSEFIQLGHEATQNTTQDDRAMFMFGDDDESYQEHSLPGAATKQNEAPVKKPVSRKKAPHTTASRKKASTSGVSKKGASHKAGRGP
ncbi:hypothetical protein ABBQ32_004296 [Trebouxia sp. C0010 RCD-2024]